MILEIEIILDCQFLTNKNISSIFTHYVLFGNQISSWSYKTSPKRTSPERILLSVIAQNRTFVGEAKRRRSLRVLVELRFAPPDHALCNRVREQLYLRSIKREKLSR